MTHTSPAVMSNTVHMQQQSKSAEHSTIFQQGAEACLASQACLVHLPSLPQLLDYLSPLLKMVEGLKVLILQT